MDLTAIIVCAAAFYAYTIIAGHVLFKPFLELYEARERATSGAEGNARETIEQAEEIEARFQESITDAQVDAMRIKMEKLGQARKEASRIVNIAEDDAHRKVASARAENVALAAKIRGDLAGDAEKMSDEIVTRLKQPVQITL